MQRIALLESERHGSGGKSGGAAASVMLHLGILGFAIAATAQSGIGRSRETSIFIPLPKFRPVASAPAPIAQEARQSVVTPKVPAIAIPAPTVIPTTISAPALTASMPAVVGSSLPAIPGAGRGRDSVAAVSTGGNVPFDVEEVDIAASAMPGQRGPAYPEGLRMLGVEGRVTARFIIGKNGRVENDPAILVSTADEFSSAVKKYLATAKYRPALKNGDAVRQLAEQEFHFAMRR